MMNRNDIMLGLYEKAVPHSLSWPQKLEYAKSLGFDFLEMSIDESDERLSRLEWPMSVRKETAEQILESGIRVPSICLSGHRRYPLGSKDPQVREKALQIMEQAIKLAADIGVRVIQVAGYDEYYEPSDEVTDRLFRENYAVCERMARKAQVMLAFEIMDTPYLNSITRFLELKRQFPSCWTSVYPDVGNISAWGNDVAEQLELGIHWTVGIHLKDTVAVTSEYEGKFKEVPFGSGCVDFISVFKVLKGLSYAGPFMMEMWTGKGENPEDEIIQAKEFILSCMREAGFLLDSC